MDRTIKTIFNIFVSCLNSGGNIILQFIVRTFFVNILGSYYLGLNGLFTNILNILSIGELGLGTAIMFSLYKPIAENDYNKINSLNHIYKKLLKIISVSIFTVGFLLSFKLDLLINIPLNNEIKIVYFLFLFDTCLSYWFLDKENLIVAHQKKYIVNSLSLIVNLIMSIVQIMTLLITSNFYIYLIIKIFFDFIRGYYLSKKARKMYPFIDSLAVPLDDFDKRAIIKNVKALSIYKLCSAILTGTDNIIISKYINLRTVGLVSNYTLIVSGIDLIIRDMFNSIIAILGNYSVSADEKKQLPMFYLVQLTSFIIYGASTICLLILLEPFITIWIGKKNLIDFSVAFIIIINFYLVGMNRIMGIYREVLGLFDYGKYRPLFMAILNILFSLIFVYYFGLIGVYLGTIISRLITQTWYDPYIIFKHGFNAKISNQYKRMFFFIIKLIITYILIKHITDFFPISNLFYIVIKGLFTLIFSIILLSVSCLHMKESKNLINICKELYNKVVL
ncbi:hypothetical protein MKC73_08745 [[Clostridium] innocuum]|nr:hypothetical protein [[Clostridium] innocuum]